MNTLVTCGYLFLQLKFAFALCAQTACDLVAWGERRLKVYFQSYRARFCISTPALHNLLSREG